MWKWPYILDPYFRWMVALRPSASSMLNRLLALLMAISLVSTTGYSRFAFGKAAKSSANTVEDEEDDSGDGDPDKRYEKSHFKDQNCDPTLLMRFYAKSNLFNCLLDRMASCACPLQIKGTCILTDQSDTAMTIYMAGSTGLASAGSGMYSAIKEAHDKLVIEKSYRTLLEHVDESARLTAERTEEELTRLARNRESTVAKLAAEGTHRSLLVSRSEIPAIARTTGGVMVRRGLLYGIVGVGFGAAAAMVYASIEAYSSLTKKTGCDEWFSNQPEFRKYVPIEAGTCSTPDYNVNARQVQDFIKLPLKDKLDVLKKNPRVCGFYQSMNVHLDRLIANIEGSTVPDRVTCSPGSGDIEFTVRGKKTQIFRIHRKAHTSDLTSFDVSESLNGRRIVQAKFDIAKTERGQELTTVSLSRGGTVPQIMNYEQFASWLATSKETELSDVRVDDAQTLLYDFRTLRKHAPTMIKCCDMKERELSTTEGRETCPPELFGKGSHSPFPAESSESSGSHR